MPQQDRLSYNSAFCRYKFEYSIINIENSNIDVQKLY